MRSSLALLSVVLIAGCAGIHSHPCIVPTPKAPVVAPAPEPTPAPVETPAPVVETPAPAPAPAEVAPVPAPAPVDLQALFNSNMHDIFFDFDKSSIRPDQTPVLDSNIAFLRSNPTVRFSIVSSTDVRGTTPYNVALGKRRVDAVHAALVAAGVDGDRTVSVSTQGKTSAYCSTPASAESCYKLNRRVHFVYVGN